MLDIRLFREQPDFVREGLRKVGEDPAMVNAIVQADERRRRLLVEVEQLKAERNAVSKQIGAMRDKAARDARIAEMRSVGDRIAALDQEVGLYGTGNLPKFGDNLYHDYEDDFWLIPTAEVPVTNLYRDEILDGAVLPIKHVAYTPCWRREQMSAGRDVRGIKRGHQFDKVEMVKFVRPEDSADELRSLLADAEAVCQKLGLRYRIVQMCTGDLSFQAANKLDIEVWSPGCQEWLEVSSCSNFKDFQARRAQIRFRPEPGAKPEFVHTLNGSGLALPRIMIAVLENYQRADGSIEVPDVLQPFMRSDVIRG